MMMHRILLILAVMAVAIWAAPGKAAFEVVSIKASPPSEQVCRFGTSQIQPARFGCHFADLLYLWGPWHFYPARLIRGLPPWASSWRFDMRAKATTPVGVQDADREFARAMEERFQFRWHWEERPAKVLVLVPANGGLKLTVAKPCVRVDPGVPPPAPALGSPPVCGRLLHPGTLDGRGTGFEATGITIARLILALQDVYREPISDQTGYAGMFDLRLMFARDRAGVESDEPGGLPSLETALRSVGLRLIRKPGIEKVFVVDSLQRPTEN